MTVIDLDELDLPLFRQSSNSAREFHSRDAAQMSVLAQLRQSKYLTKQHYESCVSDGSRLAPTIEQLRNAHGFTISGDGSVKKPYCLNDVNEQPSLARVTPELKSAYYCSSHWKSVRQNRFLKDGGRCVVCQCRAVLQCHHLHYKSLFNEKPEHLLTVCSKCHRVIHESCRLKFPSGIPTQYAHLLGWKGFESWLLP